MEILLILFKIISGIFILATLFIMLANMAKNKKAQKITKAINTITKISTAYAISLVTAFAIVIIIP